MTHTGRLIAVALLALCSACSTLPRHPVPPELRFRATIPGVEASRAWAGTFSKQFEKDLVLSVRQSIEHARARGLPDIPMTNILSLSGGGESGAFGAGFMQGWTETGTRPEFKLVSGISTGSLIAPFAFLGPAYDGQLKSAFTTVSSEDVFSPRWITFLWNDALADTAPLANLIERYITDDLIRAVAQAHREGRRLFIGTTNLDADQLVIWNMGAIAGRGDAKAYNLFRRIILASSSIPAAFPPVLIQVEIDGVTYDEMHVDGGVKAQLFVVAATLDLERFRREVGKLVDIDRKRNIYVIRNGEIDPEPRAVPRNLADISRRAMSSMIKSQTLNDLNRIYELSREQGLDFHWIALPPGYKPTTGDVFDPREMNRLYEFGYEMGKRKNVWLTAPPGARLP